MLWCAEHDDALRFDEAIYGLKAEGRQYDFSVCEGAMVRVPAEARVAGPARVDVYEVTSTRSNPESDDASMAGMQWHARLFGLSEETARRCLPNASRLLLGRLSLES